MYYNGEGVEVNKKEAFIWYKESAENNFSSAQLKLGSIYYNQIGVVPDNEEALYWMEKGVEQNYNDFVFNYGFGRDGKERVYNILLKSAEQGGLIAQITLGWMY